MLSVLIPTFNYNVYPLVLEIKQQCDLCKISYEIIVQDDASNIILKEENQKLNQLANCVFFQNETNYGRSKNRNVLAQKAKFDWLLFLDCDTLPLGSDFISTYVAFINQNNSFVCFGGLTYQTKKPNDKELLRWIYGTKREAISLPVRIRNPAETALTSNLLVKKEVLTQFPFDETISGYGYEDYLFFLNLKQNGVEIYHLKNEVVHLGLESSEAFIHKTEIAVQNLLYISNKYPKITKTNKIISAYDKLNQFGVTAIFNFIFKYIEPVIVRNLTSNKPSLFLFDIFKLGNFIKSKESEFSLD